MSAKMIPPPPKVCRKGHSRMGFRWEENRIWRCRECSRDRYLKTRQDLHAAREQNREKQARWAAQNREKRRAYSAVRMAVKAGVLVRPDRCERCGKVGTVQASHDDYARPLDVEWLCPLCHGQKDARWPVFVPEAVAS